MADARGAHRTVEGLESLLTEAQDLLARRTVAAERLSAPRNEFETDMATVSGIRRKPNPRADAQRWNRFDREAAAWAQVREAQTSVDSLTAQLIHARRNAPVPFTTEDLKAATHLRTRYGWREIVKVNTKTVSVATGYSWTDRIPKDQIMEVRRIEKTNEGTAA